MYKQNSHLDLVIRILLLSVTAIGMACSLAWGYYAWAGVMALLVVWQVFRLLKKIDRNNRKIAYLFSAILNEDFSTRFSEKVHVDSEQEMHASLNKVNELIRDAQITSRVQERYFEEILNQARIGILTINQQGHVLFSNPRALELFNCTQLNHLSQIERVDRELHGLLKGLEPFERRLFQFQNERETIQLAIKSSQIRVHSDLLTLVVIQDIGTELDNKETESWNRLIRVLTHEIMNTIAPITSISESILRYFKSETGVRSIADLREEDIVNTVKGLEVIEDQGNDLVNFVQSYRNFLKVPVPDREVITVYPLLERVKLLLSHQTAYENVEINLATDSEQLEIFADEKLISLVLINLCKNGLEAMNGAEESKLEISYGLDRDSQKFIRIKDNGPGISADILDQIFIPFFSTKDKGTGIGLSLSKQIMQVHEGSLTARSVVGEGTMFLLRF